MEGNSAAMTTAVNSANANYGALDDSTSIEMKTIEDNSHNENSRSNLLTVGETLREVFTAEPNDALDGEDIGMANVRRSLMLRRLLALYQVFLVITLTIIIWVLFDRYGMLEHAESKHHYSMLGHASVENRVSSFKDAFVHQTSAGNDKTDAPASLPDLVFLLFPSSLKWFGDEEGQWTWSHGVLYATMPTSLLHGISAGILDPTFVSAPFEKEVQTLSEHCITPLADGGDRTSCLLDIIESQFSLDDRKAGILKEGFFMYTANGHSTVWKLKLNMHGEFVLKQKHLSYLERNIRALGVMVMFTAVIMASALTLLLQVQFTALHNAYLESYVYQGLFLHDPKHSGWYDETLREAVGHWKAEKLFEGQTALPEHIEILKRDINDKLMLKIKKEQGLLHVVSHGINSHIVKSPITSADSQMMQFAPSCYDQFVFRTQEVFFHVLVIMFTTLVTPQLFHCGFIKGLQAYGTHGMASGIFADKATYGWFHWAVGLNWYLNVGLMCCLVFHYIGAEFDGTFFPWLKPITRSKIFVYTFIKWQFFTEIQVFHIWITMLIFSLFLLAAAMGLVLHFFTNMFSFTAITATIVAVFSQFKDVMGKLDQVRLQVSHHQILMDTIHDHLMTQLLEMRVLASANLSDKHRAVFMPALVQIDSDHDGSVTRPEFEAKFGKLTDEEWLDIDNSSQDGVVNISEFEAFKRSKLQKSVLLVRSAFEHAVSQTLQEHGFSQWKIILAVLSLLIAIALILGILVLLMKSANAVGAVSATVSSGISALSIALFNMNAKSKDKDEDGIDVKVEKAIDDINTRLNKMGGMAITDLVLMLRFFPQCIDTIGQGIEEAKAVLSLKVEHHDKKVQAFVMGSIECASQAYDEAKAKGPTF